MSPFLALAMLHAAQSLFFGASRSTYKNGVRTPVDFPKKGTAVLAYHN